MKQSYARRKAPPMTALPGHELKQTTQKQLQAAVGAGEFQHRDPVAHLKESFQQTFDGLGRQAAERLSETGGLREQTPGISGMEAAKQREPSQDSTEQALLSKTRMDSEYAPRHPEGEGPFFRKFSETAFQRGKLAGAVLEGSGQVMLFSCLKRTFGRMNPQHIQQRKLFQAASAHSQMPGSPQNLAVYNKGYTDSAVAMVTNVAANARRTVDTMAQLARRGGNGSETLQKMYPFLNDRREQALAEQYQTLLADETLDPEQRRILDNALSQTRTILENKHQMKEQFIATLNHMSNRAAETLEIFSQEAFRNTLYERLKETIVDLPAPEDAGAGEVPPEPSGEDTPQSAPGAEPAGGEDRELGTDRTDKVPAAD